MNTYIRILLAAFSLVALTALGQSQVTTVPNNAALLNLRPLNDKPVVRVQGDVTANDGGGGLWIWKPASTAATNTLAAQGPIAYPYGSAAGRYENLIQNRPLLNSATASGTMTFPDGSVLSFASGSSLVAATGSLMLVDQLLITGNWAAETYTYAAATRGYVDTKSNVIVADLVALKAIVVGSVSRLAVVLNDTGNDAAAGDWYWDPVSLGDETVVCVVSDQTGTGRWFKR